jgi:hypothetical protein
MTTEAMTMTTADIQETGKPPSVDAFIVVDRLAEPDDTVSLVMWCDYCLRWHWHGGGRVGDPEMCYGHRVAHCVDFGRDGYTHGYVLRPAGTITRSEMDRRARERRKALKQARAAMTPHRARR